MSDHRQPPCPERTLASHNADASVECISVETSKRLLVVSSFTREMWEKVPRPSSFFRDPPCQRRADIVQQLCSIKLLYQHRCMQEPIVTVK